MRVSPSVIPWFYTIQGYYRVDQTFYKAIMKNVICKGKRPKIMIAEANLILGHFQNACCRFSI